MCVHSHSSVNLRKYGVNYLPAAVKDENTMTMATAMKNANDTTLATLSASTIVLLGRITIWREALVPLCLDGFLFIHCSPLPRRVIYT